MSSTCDTSESESKQPPSQGSLLREHLERLNAKLMSGSGTDNYKDSLRLIHEIQELRKQIRTPPPPIDVGSSQWAPARIAYAIETGALHWKGADISPLLLRYEDELSWWLKRYADDPNRPEESRSFVKTYVSPDKKEKPAATKVTQEAAKKTSEHARSEFTKPAEKIPLKTDNVHRALSEYVIHYPRKPEGPSDLITSRVGLAVFLAIVVTIAPIAAMYFTNFVLSQSATGILLLVVAVAVVLLAVYIFAVRYDRRSADAENKRALEWFCSPEGVLLRSAKGGDLEALQTALGAGAPPDASGETGTTALMLASAGGHARMVHLLLRAGADPNRFDAAGHNALVHAAVNGQLAVIRELIKHGARPDAQNTQGKMVLMAMIDHPGFAAMIDHRRHARQPAHLEILRIIIAEGQGIETPDNKGRLPIIAAVESGLPEIVRTLLEAGANPNCLYAAPNEYDGDITALMIASRNGDGPCVETLLRAGADHKFRSIAEITPLMVAAGGFKNNGARDDELAGWAGANRDSRVRAVRALVAAGAEVNALDGFGGTATMYATHMDRDVVIRVLADAGADLDASEEYQIEYVQSGPIFESRVPVRQGGVTALMYAAGEGRTMAALTLVELGANTELKNSDGSTALEIAKRTHPDTAAAMSKAIRTRRHRIEVPTT